MCKAIADSTQTQINSQVLQNGTVRFEIIGYRIKQALKYIFEEFCKVAKLIFMIVVPKAHHWDPCPSHF